MNITFEITHNIDISPSMIEYWVYNIPLDEIEDYINDKGEIDFERLITWYAYDSIDEKYDFSKASMTDFEYDFDDFDDKEKIEMYFKDCFQRRLENEPKLK